MAAVDALERFEKLVLTQQPPSEPWGPVTDYSFEARKEIEGRHPQLILDVFHPKSIVDVGCGFKTLVNLLNGLALLNGLTDRPIATGWDVSNPLADRPFDLSQPHVWSERIFDLVICREVLEHLTVCEIPIAVRNLCGLTTKYAYVTTRFHPNPQHLLDVATSDDLDPTHISMCHKDFIRMFFVLEGFRRRADLEECMDWMQKGRVLVYERVVT